MLIDVHAHIFPPAFIQNRRALAQQEPFFALMYADLKSPMAHHEQLLDTMQSGQVDASWAVGFTWQEEKNAVAHNDYLISLASEKRLYCLGAIWAKAPWALAEARRILMAGLRGLGELGFYQSDIDVEALSPFCRLCADFNVPLMLHVNEPVGAAYAGKAPMELTRIYRLIKENPATKFILSHLGGGLFFYLLLKKEVRDIMANVWLDSAAAPYLYESRALKMAVELMGADKVLLGSDYPLLSPARHLAQMRDAGLSEDELALVCGRNAGKLMAAQAQAPQTLCV